MAPTEAVWVFQEADSGRLRVQGIYLVELWGSVSVDGWGKKEDWTEEEAYLRCRLIVSADPSESS